MKKELNDIEIFDLATENSQKYTWKQVQEALKTVPFYTIDSERFERNENKYYNAPKGTFVDQCSCCGKGLKEVKFMIHTVEAPVVCPAKTTELDMAEYGVHSQGAFAIGTECRKHYSKEYIIKMG